MRSLALPILAAAGISATAAGADINVGDTLTMTLTSVNPGRTITLSLDGGVTTVNRLGGILKWSVAGEGGVKTFCTQLDETVAYSTYTYNAVALDQVPDAPPSPGPMGLARAELLKDLYARNYNTMLNATGSTAADMAGAFAMMVWEITHQDSSATTAAGILADLDFTAGNAQFTSTANTVALANSMLSGLGGGTGDFLNYNVIGLTHPTYQDLLIVVPGPASLAGIVGLAAIGRRRRR